MYPTLPQILFSYVLLFRQVLLPSWILFRWQLLGRALPTAKESMIQVFPKDGIEGPAFPSSVIKPEGPVSQLSRICLDSLFDDISVLSSKFSFSTFSIARS
jgi:hypothetical protein